MELKNRLQSDMKEALKQGNKLKLSTIRMLQARILEREVELRASRGRDCHLSDEEIQEVIVSYAKQRRQSIESYQQGGREDLVEREKQELELVEAYLPRQLTETEVRAIVDRVVRETDAQGLKDLGVVMKAVMAETRGAAEGRLVNQIAKEILIGRG